MHKLLPLLAILASAPAWADPCFTIDRSRDSSVESCGGLKVVKLSGTPQERARRYGELIRDGVLRRDIVDYFINTPDQVANSLAGLARLVSGLVINGWTSWNNIRTPEALRQEAGIIADLIGVDRGTYERATAVPDLGGVGAGLSLKPDVELPMFGCTSVARRLPDGSFAIGRNLDYSGQGVWDTNPQLTVHLPPPGSPELRHAALAADGIPYGSISGFNEAGISFFLHQAFHKPHLRVGEPVYYIGEQVLRQARTLDEAVALLKEHRPIPMWIFILSDMKTGEALVVESSSTTFFVRRMENGILAQTNFLRDPDAVSREVMPWSILWHSKNREALAFSAVADLSSPDELVPAIRATLEKQLDPSGNLSTTGSILNPETIQSLILSSQGGDWRASIGVGLTPVSSGPAVTFKMSQLWSPDAETAYEPVAQRVSPEVRRNHLRSARAYALTQEGAKPSEISALLASDPSAPAHLARAAYAFRDNRFELASKEASGGLGVYTSSGGPSSPSDVLVQEDLKFISILSDWNRLEQAPAAERWRELASANDPRIRRWVEKLKKKRGKAPSFDLGYQFYTGLLKLPAD